MYPLRKTGPHYAVIVAASAVDTNGGPVINTDVQILNIDDEPVAGLSGVENCVASPGVNASYGAGMTPGVAHAFGYAAAKHAGGVTREVCLIPSTCDEPAGQRVGRCGSFLPMHIACTQTDEVTPDYPDRQIVAPIGIVPLGNNHAETAEPTLPHPHSG